RAPRLDEDDEYEDEDERPPPPSGGKGLLGRVASMLGGGSAPGSAPARRRASPGGDTINVFTVASGHMYERLQKIMFLSVLRHTKSNRVYLEAYTSILLCDKAKLEALYGKEVVVADREMVESRAEEILAGADVEDVAFLVAISVVFFTDSWRPDSFYDKILANRKLGLHTLCLLDIKVKEPDLAALARGRTVYEPPRYMTVNTAIQQLLEVEAARQGGAFGADTLGVGISRLQADDQQIVAGTLEQLLQAHAFVPCASAPAPLSRAPSSTPRGALPPGAAAGLPSPPLPSPAGPPAGSPLPPLPRPTPYTLAESARHQHPHQADAVTPWHLAAAASPLRLPLPLPPHLQGAAAASQLPPVMSWQAVQPIQVVSSPIRRLPDESALYKAMVSPYCTASYMPHMPCLSSPAAGAAAVAAAAATAAAMSASAAAAAAATAAAAAEAAMAAAADPRQAGGGGGGDGRAASPSLEQQQQQQQVSYAPYNPLAAPLPRLSMHPHGLFFGEQLITPANAWLSVNRAWGLGAVGDDAARALQQTSLDATIAAAFGLPGFLTAAAVMQPYPGCVGAGGGGGCGLYGSVGGCGGCGGGEGGGEVGDGGVGVDALCGGRGRSSSGGGLGGLSGGVSSGLVRALNSIFSEEEEEAAEPAGVGRRGAAEGVTGLSLERGVVREGAEGGAQAAGAGGAAAAAVVVVARSGSVDSAAQPAALPAYPSLAAVVAGGVRGQRARSANSQLPPPPGQQQPHQHQQHLRQQHLQQQQQHPVQAHAHALQPQRDSAPPAPAQPPASVGSDW
ncbi:Diphthine synthase, partial [Tetrabaena socialis]